MRVLPHDRRGQFTRDYTPFPRVNKDSHRTEGWRWTIRGIRFPHVNLVVRLECTRVGRRVVTRRDWRDASMDRVNAAAIAERRCRDGGRGASQWREIINQAEAEIVLRQTGI